ncbi:SDR family oxidoreductase [Nonomuraea sp. C10]|uniref:SDR family oxidoreductase n=1 Tax=Nonomuraea sp. C10 TaxID=2600577 RepID=UPI0011CE16FE|nr:NmrA family NAD(P)-binding protein [Nonomuraea sp. C10]TXK41116.1 NAD-dependent epimerase/dehydratase family protein [Nonomuraea sp. C10]
MRFLVFGAAGAQGGAVARRLAESGYEVRGFTRTGKVPEGVTPFHGDLSDAGRVKAAFTGVTHASVVLPLVFEAETVAAFTRNVIEGARAAGVRRLVFNTGNRLPDGETRVAAFDTRRAAVRALRESGLPVVVLRPALYLENLLAPGVLGAPFPENHPGDGVLGAPVPENHPGDGVLRYPLPADLPVAWLGHAGLGALTVAALTGDGLAGSVVDAGGPAAVTGPELAAAFGLRYEEQDVAVFEAGLARAVGAATAAEVAATYRWIASSAPAALFGPGPSLGVTLMTPAAWAAAL